MLKNFKYPVLIFTLFCLSNLANALDPNFPWPEAKLTASGISWRDPSQTIFFCYGLDANQKKLLNGVEFSFRPNDEGSQSGACNNLIYYSYQAITGRDLKNPGVTNTQNFEYGETTFNDYPFEFITFRTPGNSIFGWYRLNSKSVFERQKEGFFSRYKYASFSEGAFGAPLDGIPKTGIGSYKGVVSNPTRIGGDPALVQEVPVATVDYAKGEISISATIPSLTGGSIRITSVEPIQFNKINGNFAGKVRIMANTKSIAYINGFLGGRNADGLFAMFSPGDAFSGEGIDFILGMKK